MFYSSLTSHVAIWFGSLKEHIQERQKDWVWYKTLSKPFNLLYIVSIENRFNSYIFYSVLWKSSDFLELSFIEISPSFESLAVLHNPISVTRVIMCFHTWRAPVDSSVILHEVYYGVREKRKQEINQAKSPQRRESMFLLSYSIADLWIQLIYRNTICGKQICLYLPKAVFIRDISIVYLLRETGCTIHRTCNLFQFMQPLV